VTALTKKLLDLRAASFYLSAVFIKAKTTSCLTIFVKQGSPGTEVKQWLLSIGLSEHDQHNHLFAPHFGSFGFHHFYGNQNSYETP
jgi:hypothetical protein